MTDTDQYFDYLNRRSRLGYWYRRGWLYPQLKRHLRGRVLDIGCGIGDMLRSRPDTVGVDINPATVAHCRKQGLDARLMEANRLPFEDGSFDGAILDNVLEHIEQPQPLLAETRRVLRQGATLLVGVPGERGYSVDPDHKVFYDAAGLERTVSDAGFEVSRILGMPLPLDSLSRRLKIYCLYGVFRRT